ncbi:hypothetical protein, partial [Phascolarctobacterium faecium]
TVNANLNTGFSIFKNIFLNNLSSFLNIYIIFFFFYKIRAEFLLPYVSDIQTHQRCLKTAL